MSSGKVSKDQKIILDVLRNYHAVTEETILKSGGSISSINALRTKGLIKKLPDGRYQIN